MADGPALTAEGQMKFAQGIVDGIVSSYRDLPSLYRAQIVEKLREAARELEHPFDKKQGYRQIGTEPNTARQMLQYEGRARADGLRRN